MKHSLWNWVCLVVAGALLWQSLGSDLEATLALPLEPVRGARLDAAVEAAPTNGQENGDAPVLMLGGVPFVDFGRFLFKDYDAPELRDPPGVPLTPAEFPETIRDQHAQEIAVEGYALAADLLDGRIQSVILSRFPPGCCFGTMPVLDEWIEVTLEAGGSEPLPSYLPVKVAGTLEIGEELDETGAVLSIYRLTKARRIED